MMPNWLYCQDLAKFRLNHHYKEMLNMFTIIPQVLGRPLRGLSSKQPVPSNFEIILATAAFVNGPLPLRIPFVWR
ncbi:hypothetical protein TNCV_1561551 [Trichonephila clavipes]|nr:hypothetical protein TNCV_1561551 [Trichonephila clavipes]